MVFAINDMGSDLHLRKMKGYKHTGVFFMYYALKDKTRTAPEN